MPDQIMSFYVGLAHETEISNAIDDDRGINHHVQVPFAIIVLKYIFKVLLYCTAVINPIIYCFMIRSFQIRLGRMVDFKRAKRKGLMLDRRIIISSFVETSMAPVSNSWGYSEFTVLRHNNLLKIILKNYFKNIIDSAGLKTSRTENPAGSRDF